MTNVIELDYTKTNTRKEMIHNNFQIRGLNCEMTETNKNYRNKPNH